MRVALPSRGRLRDACLALLEHAGYATSPFRGSGSRATIEGIEFIEMRPRDAAAWLAARQVDAAFLSTDLVLESSLAHLAAVPLGLARSDLVVASREDDGRTSAADLAGATVATHLPNATTEWFRAQSIDVTVVPMGGALEGVCASGLADAIVDLRETGQSLVRNRLRVLAEIAPCEALFVHREGADRDLDDLILRMRAVLRARVHRYVMLHLPPARLGDLQALFGGLAAPTVLPLAGRDDLLAVHLVVGADELWTQLGALRQMGATGIVALPPDALVT